MIRLYDIIETKEFPDGTYYYLNYEKAEEEARKHNYEIRKFRDIQGIAIYDGKEELIIVLAVDYDKPKVLLIYTDASFGIYEDAVLTSDLNTVIIDDKGILVPDLFR